MRRASLLIGAVVLVLATACGGSSNTSASGSGSQAGGTTSSATATGSQTLRISGFAYGTPLTVRPGEKILVVNADGAPHTVTADSGGAFDVSVEGKASATMTAPAKPGTYPFHCTIHPSMHGTLIVR